MRSSFRRRLLGTSIIACAAAAANPVMAQAVDQEAVTEEAAAASDVVVTGSRITNPNLEQSSPVAVVGAEEIQLQAVVSAEELLRDLPGSIPSIGSNVNNGSGGQAFLNLRGLGANRNLVLIDGNRLVPATLSAQVDTNLIPLALIERVDVFTGGASTVYGADAVAGVVNFVTKRDFAGIDVTALSGVTEQGDGSLFKIDVTLGANFGDGKGNATFSVGYTETDPVYQGNRDFSRVALSSVTGLPQGSTTSVPITFRAPLVGQLNLGTGALGAADPAGYNFAPLNLFQTPIRRFNIFGKANYDITDNIEAFTSAFFVKSKVDFLAAPAGIFANPLLLPLSNPFLPAALRSALCAADSNSALAGIQAFRTPAQCAAGAAATSTSDPNYFEVPITSERRFVEAGPRVTEFTTTTFQINMGLRGALTSNLNWDINAAYGESERVTEASGAGFAPLQQGLRAFNATTCTVTTGGCVPLNIFGGPGTLTPAMINFLSLTTFAFVKTAYAEVKGGVTGDLGITSPLATNGIGIAIGGEYRKYKGESFGDAISRQPGAVLGAGAAALPVFGTYDSYEAYGEIIIPLIEDRSFFKSLTVEGGIRYSDYSTSGGNTTWKAGGSWEPFDSLKLRGMYTRAVRAPNLLELFQPQVVALANLSADPCQGQTTNAAGANYNAALAGSAPLRALCIATGVPAGVLGTGAIPAPSAGQIQTTQGGNPNLDPEKATTLTLGGVFQPSFLRNLSLSVDYYHIKVKEAISSPTVLDVVNGCYTVALNPTLSASTAACQGIGRNGAGRLDGAAVDTPGVFLAATNQGLIETSGIDATLNWRTDLGFARFIYSLNGNYTFESKFQATPVSVNRECVGYYSTSCGPNNGGIQQEFVWNQRTTLSFDAVDVSLLWRHIAKAVKEPLAPAAFAAFEKIPAYDYFDLSIRTQVAETASVTFTVTNLFDKDPPIVGSTIGATAFNGGNTFPSNYDPLGRRFTAGVNLRF